MTFPSAEMVLDPVLPPPEVAIEPEPLALFSPFRSSTMKAMAETISTPFSTRKPVVMLPFSGRVMASSGAPSTTSGT